MEPEAALSWGRRMRAGWVCALLAGATIAGAACGSDASPSAGDASATDAGAADTGVTDASPGDAIPADASPADVSATDGEPWPPAAGHWDTLAPVPALPRFYGGMAAARGRLFMIGGVAPGKFDTGPERTAVQAYTPATNSWETLAPLPTPVIMPNVVGVGDQLYVLGAMDVIAAFAYDFNTRDWVFKRMLPVTRGPGGAVVGVWNTTVLLAGGAVHGQSANDLNTGMRQSTLLAYETTRNEWTTLPEMPVAVGYALGAVINDQLWVMGGSTDFARTDDVLVYDIPTRTWSASAVKLPAKISSGAAAVIRGRIYMPSGLEGVAAQLKQETLVFNPPAGFASVAAIPTPRFGNAAAVIDGKLYVASGLKAVGDSYDVAPDFEVFTP
jgi:N-acetylneuraminic acid mutarotase